MQRYVLWAHLAGTQAWQEQVLLDSATANQCDIIERIAANEGWDGFRRMLLDDSPPDFIGTVAL